MTTHDVKTAWSRVGDELSGLGLKLKLHAEQEMGDDDPTEVKAALKRLSDAIEDAAEAVGNAAKDPSVREDIVDVGHSLASAMGQTMSHAGQTMSRAGKEIRSKIKP